ncbi:MAG: hypothetical protein RIS70_386, partial [Planctomycetota bacterium]
GKERPNIVLLFADDQRADTIAAWGNAAIDTPHLDRLVRRGLSFRQNYCFGSNSGAVCIPSRAMLMTGKSWFDVEHDLRGETLLPEHLRRAGYRTFATGKWHNGQRSLERAFPDAKSVFLGGMSDHTQLTIRDVQSGKCTAERPAAKFSSEQFAESAIEFLETQTGDAPFFCYVAFTAPHDPRNPPESYRQRYYDRPPPLPKNFLPQHPFDNGFAKNVRDENLAGYPRSPETIREQLSEYYGLITHLDAQVGRILEVLERRNLQQNTIVIYAADHGLALGSHGLLGKQSVYEHSMKCPLIIAGPGVPQEQSSEAFTYLFDLFPTILRLAGAELPEGLRGADLGPVWRGESSAVRDSVFLPFSQTMRAVRDERWKLIHYPQIGHRQLFDLKSDPDECCDLASQEAYREHADRLERLLVTWQTRLGDRQTLHVAEPKPKEIRYDDFSRKPDIWQPKWIVKKYFDPECSPEDSR